jgi:hypothetical protein
MERTDVVEQALVFHLALGCRPLAPSIISGRGNLLDSAQHAHRIFVAHILDNTEFHLGASENIATAS